MIQSGLNTSVIRQEITPRQSDTPLNICWCGNLTPSKGLSLVLKGLLRLKNVNWHLHILGEGFQREFLEQMATGLGIADRCTFYGRQSREFVLKKMQECHLFVLLSYHDLAPSVVGEAYASGLPVIALDTDGFRHIVDSSSGALLFTNSSEQVENDLAQTVKYFYEQEQERQKLAKNALSRASCLTFDAKEKDLIDYIEQHLRK